VAGGSPGIDNIATAWRVEELSWRVRSEAGLVAEGVLKSDQRGTISPRCPVPDVRVTTRLALAVAPQDQPASAVTWEVIVLPKDPVGEVRKALGAQGIGRLPSGGWDAAVKRSGLDVTELQFDVARSQFRGRVVLLGGLLGGSADATRQWISSLPADTCVVVLGGGQADKDLLAILPYLKAGEPPKRSTLHAEPNSPVWTDLPVEWLCEAAPSLALAQPRGVLSLRVLAGSMDDEGTVYPLAMETVDRQGRRWLIWSPRWDAGGDDPRWDLLLRNSLLWAADALSRPRASQTRPA